MRKECQPLGGGVFEVLLDRGMERVVQEEGARVGNCRNKKPFPPLSPRFVSALSLQFSR